MAKKYIKGKAAPLKEGQVRVESGDSLWRLAEKYTGSGTNWKQLNGGKKLIKPGDVIDIPQKIWNPEVEIDGEKHRWRSKEYKEAYNRTTDKEGDIRKAQKEHRTAEAKKGADGAHKAMNYVGQETFATAMNTLDMPRRLVAGVTNENYSLKEAINPVGRQPYKSVTGDRFQAENPYTAAGIDMATGLLAWNLPGITRSVVKTGSNLARSQSAIAAAGDDVARMKGLPAKELKKAVDASKATAGKANPKTHDFITSAVRSGEATGSSVTKNTQVATKAGKVAKGTGTKGKSGWNQQSRPANSGKTGGGYQKGDYSGVAKYAIPNAGPVYSPFIPIPGLPGGIPPPVVVPGAKARIETKTPGQVPLSKYFEGTAQGDTIVMPGGEMIVNRLKKKGSPGEWKERMFDIESRNTYDENSNDVTKQNWIPRASDVTFKKGQKSVNKYSPAVPEEEIRTNRYYPDVVGGKSSYKPIRYQKGGKAKKLKTGDDMANGKPLKSGFKKTTYIAENKRLTAKGDSLKALPNAHKTKIKAQIYKNNQAMEDLKASQTPKVYKKKKVKKKEAGGPIKRKVSPKKYIENSKKKSNDEKLAKKLYPKKRLEKDLKKK